MQRLTKIFTVAIIVCLIVSLSFLSGYYYLKKQLEHAVVEGSVGIITAFSKIDTNATVTVYDRDSVDVFLSNPTISNIVSELEKDTLTMKIFIEKRVVD